MIDLFGKRAPHKILSVRQPWAWLIVSGQKTIENRTWITNYRGPLYIHAGIRLHDMPASQIEQKYRIEINQTELQFGAIIGFVDLVDIVSYSKSRWFDGPYGWVLHNPQIIKPIALRGQMGLFDVPKNLRLT